MPVDRPDHHLAPPARRRSWRLVSLLTLTFVALAALLVLRAGASPAGSAGTAERATAELATGQWQRLTQRIARATAALRAPALSATVASVTAAAPSAASLRPLIAELDAGVLARQAAAYDARRPKSVIDLQKFRRSSLAPIADGAGRHGNGELVNLNPRVNFWYLLRLTWDGEPTASYHLTNSRPETHSLVLDSTFATGLVLADRQGRTRCDLWSKQATAGLAAASRLSTPYVTLCDDEVTLRRPTAGSRTSLEWAADLLRDHLWGGETLTVLVRDHLYSDANLLASELSPGAVAPAAGGSEPGRPTPALVAPEHAGDLLTPVGLGLLPAVTDPRLHVGSWYPAPDNPGVFVSALQPGLVASSVLASGPGRAGPGRASPLDDVEAAALTYLVAFDLSRFELGFALGTDHPRVGWSERVRPEMRDDSLPGPDGIGDIAPLVAGGIIPYSLAERTVASFTGGFKRSHGAFESGLLGQRNFGSHYGFIESGVVLSKLQPGLATIFALDDGSVQMKTWSRADDALLERVAFARQNGVPIVETDPATGASVPGALVARWGDGNWSGSEDRKLRSVRAGICLQDGPAGRFLLYGYFSSATPTAMARVFQAYGCGYAMITDMNALEHTYLALYRVVHDDVGTPELTVDHLITGMDVLDKVVEGRTLPRFLGFADNRDFFYVMRRLPNEQPPPVSPLPTPVASAATVAAGGR